MATVTLEINGQKITAEPDKTILEVVSGAKLDRIPTLCHSPELRPYGSCFLCVVEVTGRPMLVPACATRVAEGMKVATRNERILASRKTALELLLSNHYADCVSPCALACPAGVDCQGYVALAAMGRFGEAVDLVRRMNPLPSICGRICVRKCEVECRRADVDEPVGINHIKRFVADSPGAYEGSPRRMPSRGKTVGIIGSGPAGLTAAWYLGLYGYDPVIYEALPKPGGMLRYGIPEYRLPSEVIDREVDYVLRAGGKLKTDVRVGRDVGLAELMKRHAAVFIAAGAMGSKGMGVEGEDKTEGVVRGVDFLRAKVEERAPVKGIVVVVGGGNTAMDVARTSWRLGADRVILLYRRTKAEMPADKLEIEDCLKEGIEIMELAAPVGIVAEAGKLKGLKCIRMKLGEPDKSGRRRPVPQEGSEFTLPCDLAVSAIGQDPVLAGLSGGEVAPKLTQWNTIATDPVTLKTSVENLFAGGDVADDGPTVVVDAVRDGRRAALSIHESLSGEKVRHEPFVVRKAIWAKPSAAEPRVGAAEIGEIRKSPRRHPRELEVPERAGSFKEVTIGYEPEDVSAEAGRCLACGCVVYDRCDLRLYADEYHVDMGRWMGHIRKHKIDGRHPHIVYDPNKCILCARCIRTCARVLPTAALGLVGRGFKTEMRPAMNDPLVETNCVSCGNCIDACPTGALTVKFPFPGRACLPTEDLKTHCAFCSVGCELTVSRISDDRYYASPAGAAGEYLCRYGRFGAELFLAQRRVERPQAREGGQQKPVGLAQAVEKTVAALKAAAKKHGPEAVGVFVSPELSSEEMYLAARIAREGLGTNNISSLSLLCAGTDSGALDASLGFTASTADRSAVRSADLILCDNSDALHEHMVLSVEIMDAVRRGAKLILAGSAVDSLAPLAALTLDPMRGRAAMLLNGVIQALLDKGFFNRDVVRKLEGGPEFLGDMTDYGPKTIAEMTGVEESKIEAAAAFLEQARKVAVVFCPDRSQDRSPGDIQVLANLALLLRSAGARADLLLAHLAANGAAVETAGADPAFVAGRLPAKGLPGCMDRRELFAQLQAGRLKAALIVGEDPMRDDKVASYFGDAEFLAVADWCQTETTRFADVVLPASTFLESEGTRVNFEGAVTRYARTVPAPSVDTLRVLAELAKTAGVSGAEGGFAALHARVDRAARAGLGDKARFCWNTGEPREWDGKGRLIVAEVRTRPSPISPPLTVSEQYKRQSREVGLARFRVLA